MLGVIVCILESYENKHLPSLPDHVTCIYQVDPMVLGAFLEFAETFLTSSLQGFPGPVLTVDEQALNLFNKVYVSLALIDRAFGAVVKALSFQMS